MKTMAGNMPVTLLAFALVMGHANCLHAQSDDPLIQAFQQGSTAGRETAAKLKGSVRIVQAERPDSYKEINFSIESTDARDGWYIHRSFTPVSNLIKSYLKGRGCQEVGALDRSYQDPRGGFGKVMDIRVTALCSKGYSFTGKVEFHNFPWTKSELSITAYINAQKFDEHKAPF